MSKRRHGKFKTLREMLKRCLKNPGRSQRINIRKNPETFLGHLWSLGICNQRAEIRGLLSEQNAERGNFGFSSRLQIISPIVGHYLSLLEFPLSCSLDTAARRGAKSSPSHATQRCIRIARLFCYRTQTRSYTRLIVYSNSLFFSSACAYACIVQYRAGAADLAPFPILLFSQ